MHLHSSFTLFFLFTPYRFTLYYNVPEAILLPRPDTSSFLSVEEPGTYVCAYTSGEIAFASQFIMPASLCMEFSPSSKQSGFVHNAKTPLAGDSRTSPSLEAQCSPSWLSSHGTLPYNVSTPLEHLYCIPPKVVY
jgi:hypothetical protein